MADGTKYLSLCNAGWPDPRDLRVQSHHKIKNPATRDQVRETAFAMDQAAKLNRWAEQDRFKAIVICADPESLGEMLPIYNGPLKTATGR